MVKCDEYGTVRAGFRLRVMDDPGTLRRKAARFFENAASSATAKEVERLKEVGRQLELWADDLAEIDAARGQDASEPEANGSQSR